MGREATMLAQLFSWVLLYGISSSLPHRVLKRILLFLHPFPVLATLSTVPKDVFAGQMVAGTTFMESRSRASHSLYEMLCYNLPFCSILANNRTHTFLRCLTTKDA